MSHHEPPSCNTGVATSAPGTQTTITVALDYLGCHVEEEAEKVVPALAQEMGAQYRIGRASHGYGHGAEIVSGEDVWVRLYYNRRESPYVQASGSNAQPCEDAIRRLGWSYRVARKDAAVDLWVPGLFARLVEAGKAYATSQWPQLSVEHRGDWTYSKKGRTLYIGARTSKHYHRLYEKGRKEKTDPNWIRVEYEHKPDREHEQRWACDLTPGELFAQRGYAVWAPVFKQLGIECAAIFDWPTHQQPRVRRDTVRARRALARQYGKTIERWLEECGGDAQSFVEELLGEVAHQATVLTWAKADHVEQAELQPAVEAAVGV